MISFFGNKIRKKINKNQTLKGSGISHILKFSMPGKNRKNKINLQI